MRVFERLFRKRGLVGAFLVSTAVVIIANSGITYTADGFLEDLLYQSPEVVDDTIVVIGIDSKAIEQFGAWPWDRRVLAEAVEILNEDEEYMPSAIGLDVLFAGESNPESDQALALAAKKGNLVVASSAVFKDFMEHEQSGSMYINEFYVSSFLEPYAQLKSVANVGHINAMYDKDGVLRRHLWKVYGEDGRTLESFPNEMYKLYNSYRGIDKEFVPNCDDRGFWYVDFASKPGDLLVYSVADIINREYDPALLKGAAVFIGLYDPSLGDDLVTSADRSERMYGVEYMANVMRAMVNGKSPLVLSDNLQLAILFFLTFIRVLVFYESEPRVGVVILIFFLIFSFYGAKYLYWKGFVIHPLWFFGGEVFGFATSIIGHYYIAKSEKQYIKSTFERYVDSEVIKELLKERTDNLNLGGSLVDITVMFVDIRGFTTISELLPPTQVVEILNEYLTFVSNHIKLNGGTLDKFIGDCAMAFWGAPIECEDSVYMACKTACDMVKNADELRASIRENYNVDLSFGVGIHYGPAVVGNIGAATRMDYTAIGDTVNTASIIQSIAPKGKICISREVADILGERGVYSIFEKQQKLKGKEVYKEILLLEGLKY